MGDKWQKAKVSKFVVGENGLEIKGEYCPEPQCGPGIFLAGTISQSTNIVAGFFSKASDDRS